MSAPYYVHGETIPDKTSFMDATPYETIEAALGGARTKMSLGAAIAWIVDCDGKIVMSEARVLRAVKTPKSN